MRIQYLLSLIVVLIGYGAFWYQTTASVCPVPIYYRIGTIDPSFSISTTTLLAAVAEAEAVWEGPAKRELFQYDETAGFTIDLVFDDRQALADSEVSQRTELDAKRAENDEIQQQIESLQSEYTNLSEAYEERVATYEERLAAYNAEVNRYNDRGGAPADVYDRLETERKALAREAASLTKTADQLNALASKINELSDRGNALIAAYNAEVGEYNAEFGHDREFTQGDYQGGQIHVYKFSDRNELVAVLAHEFGHSLGMDHVAGESSLMYYLLESADQPPVVSAADMQAYNAVCGVAETTAQKVRRIVREFIN